MLPFYMIHAKAPFSLTWIVELFVFAGGCISSFCDDFHELYAWIITAWCGGDHQRGLVVDPLPCFLDPLKVKVGGLFLLFLAFSWIDALVCHLSFQSSCA